jgi:hypothetical protein
MAGRRGCVHAFGLNLNFGASPSRAGARRKSVRNGGRRKAGGGGATLRRWDEGGGGGGGGGNLRTLVRTGATAASV